MTVDHTITPESLVTPQYPKLCDDATWFYNSHYGAGDASGGNQNFHFLFPPAGDGRYVYVTGIQVAVSDEQSLGGHLRVVNNHWELYQGGTIHHAVCALETKSVASAITGAVDKNQMAGTYPLAVGRALVASPEIQVLVGNSGTGEGVQVRLTGFWVQHDRPLKPELIAQALTLG